MSFEGYNNVRNSSSSSTIVGMQRTQVLAHPTNTVQRVSSAIVIAFAPRCAVKSSVINCPHITQCLVHRRTASRSISGA